MKLRNASEADLTRVMSWIPDASSCRRWAGPDVRFPLVLKNLMTDIGFSASHAYGLYHEAAMVAFGQFLSRENGFMHLARIIVDPGNRSCGYGRILCLKMMDAVVGQGIEKFSLNVYRGNAVAMRLYHKLGFREWAAKSTPELCHMIKTEKPRGSIHGSVD